MKNYKRFFGPLILAIILATTTLWVNMSNNEVIFIEKPELIDRDGDSYTPNAGDCDDGNPLVNPDSKEIDNDGNDSNCDGKDNFAGLRRLVITTDQVTPSLPIDPPAQNVIARLGGKTIRLPEKLKRAKIELVIGYEKKYYPSNVPTHLGVGIYIQSNTEIPNTHEKYWEYFSKIGTAFMPKGDGTCFNELQKTPYTLLQSEGSEASLPTIDLSKIPLSGLKQKIWPCYNTKEVDLLSLMNESAIQKEPINIGFYTTSSYTGKIVSAVLLYEGAEIEIVKP